ncbi:hypothetical protein [Acidianus sp. HS-5]|uniref:hypothetical protein n=1 Tax=Acidianus sp. HS-5 TaxID=2886040 RepID=UPI001F2D5160|nr:hypothetical protein [Acidianus sp. HS-5]BDC18248.1 hypothetical protein HS5_11380 [Acidianus sp. HS-5]
MKDMKELENLIYKIDRFITESRIERYKEALQFLRILDNDSDREVKAEVIKLESLLLKKIEELEELLKE